MMICNAVPRNRNAGTLLPGTAVCSLRNIQYLQLIETSESRSDFEVFYYQYRKLMYYIAFDIVNDSHLAEDIVD